jgi:hypothetical protein
MQGTDDGRGTDHRQLGNKIQEAERLTDNALR